MKKYNGVMAMTINVWNGVIMSKKWRNRNNQCVAVMWNDNDENQ